VEPGEQSRFSFLASLPSDATAVGLHCEFTDKADVTETVTKTYSVPTATSKALTEFHNGAEDSDQNQRDSTK